MQVNSFTGSSATYHFKGHQIEIVYSGAPGWFDFYIDGTPRGCARANEIKSRIHNIIQTELTSVSKNPST